MRRDGPNLQFHDGAAWLAQIAMFLMLGLLARAGGGWTETAGSGDGNGSGAAAGTAAAAAADCAAAGR